MQAASSDGARFESVCAAFATVQVSGCGLNQSLGLTNLTVEYTGPEIVDVEAAYVLRCLHFLHPWNVWVVVD